MLLTVAIQKMAFYTSNFISHYTGHVITYTCWDIKANPLEKCGAQTLRYVNMQYVGTMLITTVQKTKDWVNICHLELDITIGSTNSL